MLNKPTTAYADAQIELWDVYDRARNRTGRTHRRGTPLREGDYHLVAHILIRSASGLYLITRRAPSKRDYPGMWEIPGGSAIVGEDSLSAALREAKEETGLTLDRARGAMLFTRWGDDWIVDYWLFECDFALDDIVFQDGETVGARLATADEIRELDRGGELAFPVNRWSEVIAFAEG